MSMPYILLNLHSLFENTDNRDESENAILWCLEVVTQLNVDYLRKHPETPKLYDSGVVYAVPDQMAECKIDPSRLPDLVKYLKKLNASEETIAIILAFLHGIEIFRDIPAVLNKKFCDCDNVTCYRAAELRLMGIKATPYITWRDRFGGSTTYHALVRWPDGTSEDPSLLLGMGGEEKASQRAEEIRKNKERFATYIENARQLCASGAMDIQTAGKTVDALGLLPRTKTW